MSKTREKRERTGLEIAVIGMAGRFPAAANIHEFWENLKNGVELLSFLTGKELNELEIDPGLINDPNFIKSKGGVLENQECFDASFFGYTPGEAEVMDPQVRIFHECAWSALEHAGYDPGSYNGLIGLYAGASGHFDWQALTYLTGKSREVGLFDATLLNDKDFLCTRVSFKLNLKGPAAAVQTACSTSLAAVHLACQAILNGECDMALAGGVRVSFNDAGGYIYREGGTLSPDGHCRSFDARGKGIVGGSGAGVVVLKRLEDAEADGDYIHALVKGTAINNDGARKTGYTAPSREGQSQVIRIARQVAEVEPESITYIETHGTGTSLGDPIEIEALKWAFNTGKKGFCAIGSVKTNVGHLGAAAGITGFIKTIMALKYQLIPPSLHFEKPNPNIDFENSPFYVNTKPLAWKRNNYPLRAGVSSFGIGGTNAHVILEEAPDQDNERPPTPSRHDQLILLSAKTASALDKITENLVEYLEHHPHIHIADLAYTLQVGRGDFRYRRKLVCSNISETAASLSNIRQGKVHTYAGSDENKNIVFMFPGLGGQYVNMGLGLYKTEPVFRGEMDRCFEILKPLMGYDIKEILYPDEMYNRSYRSNKSYIPDINQTEIAPVAVFVFEYALAKLLMHWGIKPHAMIGYSFGEYTAACISGVFSLEDTLKLVVNRGELIRKLPPGAMLSVPLSREELEPLITGSISISIDNGPSCIVSGPPGVIDTFEAEMKKKRYLCMRLEADRAIHSKMMTPILEEFAGKVREITLNKPGIPYISNLTGKWIAVEEAVAPGYWARHLRETVRFADGIEELVKDPKSLFVEIGPGRDLSTMVLRHIDNNSRQQVVNLVRQPGKGAADLYYLLNKIGRLWLYGADIDWSGFYSREKRYRIPLPTYPFERQQYRIEGNLLQMGTTKLSGRKHLMKKDIADWFSIPSWTRSPLLPGDTDEKQGKYCWMVFMDTCGIGSLLVDQLEQEKEEAITVLPGPGFKKIEAKAYMVNPLKVNDYRLLFRELASLNKHPNKIVHFWGVGEVETGESGKKAQEPVFTRFENARDSSFYSLLHLARALGKYRHQSLPEHTGIIEIGLITNNMQNVSGEEVLYPEKATILGLAKVIPQEQPGIRCKSIDIILPKPANADTDLEKKKITHQLRAEFSTKSPNLDTVIALRGNRRWVQTFEPIRPGEIQEDSLPLRKKGVYLITGGLGEIGFVLARYLAERFAARLILTGRSPFPPQNQEDEKIKRVKELEALGAEVLVFSADAAHRQQMARVIRQSEQHFGKINGVIHAAGITRGKSFTTVQELSKTQCQQQFQAKVYGLFILEELLETNKPDFCWVMSSISSVLGGLKFGAYASANSFTDAYVNWRSRGNPRAAHTPWISVNWDGMDPTPTVTCFQRILSLCSVEGEINQVIVSTGGNLQDRIDKWVKLESLREAQPDKDEDLPGIRFNPRPDLMNPYVEPGNELEQTIADIWQRLFGFQKIGTQDDFFELGGDSLKAISVISRTHQALGVEVPLPEFFKRSTIKNLAEYINRAEKSTYWKIEPTEKKEYYVLSSAQKRTYILHQVEKESIGYNETQVVVLAGEMDRNAFEGAFRQLIRRHESLRTSIMMREEPVQKIHDTVDFKIDYYGRETGETIETIIRNFIKPFDLSKPPFIRTALIKQKENSHVVVFDKHHIICDAVSHQIFIKEIMLLYKGESKELPPLMLQYKDFAQWHNSNHVKDSLKREQEYWIKEFKSEIPILALPTDYPRPAIQDFKGSRIGFTPGDEESKALKAFALEKDVTLYMLLLSIFNILLSKLSGQEDIVIGTPVVGRKHAELQSIIGIFVNTLALRNFPLGEKTFNVFLTKLKKRALESFENQIYPFEDLIDQVYVRRDPSRNPLFDVMFVLENTEILAGYLSGIEERKLQLKPFVYEPKISKFDLTLRGVDAGDHLYFTIEYRTGLFKQETVQRFIGYFKKVVTTVLRYPGIKLAEIELLSGQEKSQMLYDFNDTEMEYPTTKTIHELFAEQVEFTPDHTALVGGNPKSQIPNPKQVGGMHLSYRELNRQSNRLAYVLKERGVQPDTPVAIMVERSVEMIIGIMGILKAGGAYLPIDPDYPEERITYMLNDAKVKILINLSNNLSFFQKEQKGRGLSVLNFEHLDFGFVSNFEFRISDFISTNLAYIIYTSGSTGKPKGVMIEHKSVINRLHWMQRAYPLNSSDVILQKTTFTFDVSVWELFWWSFTGAGLCLLGPGEEKDPGAIIDAVINHRVTTMHFVPSMLSVFLDYLDGEMKEAELTSLRQVFASGEALKVEQVQRFRGLFMEPPGTKLINLYGPTEATVDVSCFDCSAAAKPATIPIGKPIDNIGLYVLDRTFRLQPPGTAGELFISGIGLARGYLNQPGLTAEKFIRAVIRHSSLVISSSKLFTNDQCPMTNDRLYKTGDLARWLADGNIQFLGRIDHQVKIRGFRVEPGEIETRLLKQEEIKDAVVLVRETNKKKPNGSTGALIQEKYLCAYIVSDRKFTPSAPELKAFLSGSLPGYMIPTYFIQLGGIPLTPNGKIDRKALPSPEIKPGGEYTAPRDKLEEKLVEIWSDVLSGDPLHAAQMCKSIGVNHNFFELGGHSLKAIIMISKIHRETNVKLPLAEVFKTPTIKGLSRYIAKAAKDKYKAIEPVEKKEYYGLSSAQKRMYILQQMSLTSTAYNMPQFVPFVKKPDVGRLEETFTRLILRHESLRTSFHMTGDKPVQRVHENVELEIEYNDMKEVKVEEELSSILEGTRGGAPLPEESHPSTSYVIRHPCCEFIRPFDLSQAPLLRVKFLCTGDKYILMVDMHHIICDGVSHEILMRDFMALSRKEKLPALMLQYKDYAKWQNRQLQTNELKLQEEYWLKEFNGEISVLKLPTDYPRPKIQDFAGSGVPFNLDSEKTRELNEMSRSEGTTLFMVLLAIYNILLLKISHQEDIIVGTPVAGRCCTDLQSIMGMFINTLAIRNHPGKEKTFRGFLREVKKRSLQAIENQDYPFENLVDKVVTQRDTSRNPLFDVTFVLQNLSVPGILPLDLKMKPVDYDIQTSKFDLMLTAVEQKEKLKFTFGYSTSLFKKAAILRFINYLKKIVSCVVENPAVKIGEIEIIPGEEKQKILYDFNNTRGYYPGEKTVHRLFEEQVKKAPDHSAIIGVGTGFIPSDSGKQPIYVTYRELNKKSNQLARILRKKGIKPGDMVGLMMDRSPDIITAIFSILKAGASYVPIDTAAPESRTLSILNDSNVSFLLTKSTIIGNHSFFRLKGTPLTRGKVHLTEPRPNITNLDDLPIPDRSLVDYEKYNKYIGHVLVQNCLSLQGTRGCPFNCAYCHKLWPKKHVVRSAEHLFKEVKMLYDLGVRRFSFVDDVFNFNVKNSRRFFELIIENGLKLQLFFMLRGDILTREYIDLMIEAGVVRIAVALETASPRLQKKIGKNLHIERLWENIQYMCQKHPQLILDLYTMHGFPGETEEEALMTLDFIKDTKWLHFPYVFVLKVYRNTDMEKLALESGISPQAIERSQDAAYHELPETLPFSKGFSRKYQADFLNRYFLSKERLLHVLPFQMKVLTENELVQKYNSYLPGDIGNFSDVLGYAGITGEELADEAFLAEEKVFVPDLNLRFKQLFSPHQPGKNALRVLLLDLSQDFSAESNLLSDLIEAPLGLMYLLTYLNRHLGSKVQGKIAKSLIDFDNYAELKALLNEFKPDVIGIRTLSYYHDFFYRTISVIRQWGREVPIVAGGPHATSDYRTILQDSDINLVVLGEGEITFKQLIEVMLENEKKLPPIEVLKKIKGLALPPEEKDPGTTFTREILMVDLPDHQLAAESKTNPLPVSYPSDPAYTIFTSGTTGKPKGVMVEHRSVVNLVYSLKKKVYGYKEPIPAALVSPFMFDASIKQIFPTLTLGHRLFIIPEDARMDSEQLIHLYRTHDIRISDGTPTHLALLLYGAYAPQLSEGFPVRRFVIGGQILEPSLAQELMGLVCSGKNKKEFEIINVYGPTECCDVTTTFAINRNRMGNYRRLPIGKPLDNVKVYVVGKTGEIQPIGIVGELQIAGAGVSRGYVNQPELTADKFIRNPFISPMTNLYRSGDLARWLPDGNIEFFGRIDHQLKIRGFRIESTEIEHRLRNHNQITEALVMARTNQSADKYLCAYIVSNDEIPISELRDDLSKYLPEYMIPSHFVYLEKFPLTPNGKIDRKALPGPEIKPGDGYIAPGNEIEVKLVEICSAVLGIEKEKIGIEANLFELGGNSLNLIGIVSKIYKEFKIQLPMARTFEHPTIKEISRSIASRKSVEDPVMLLNGLTPKKLFCFPPGAAFGAAHQALASIIHDYSFYSFNFIEDENRLNQYVDIITKLQPVGPYILYGWSAAGGLTFEVAKALENQGHEVADIILADSFPSENKIVYHEPVKKHNEFIEVMEKELERLGAAFLKDKVRRKIEKYLVYTQNITSLETINADVHLILSEQSRREKIQPGWDKLTTKSFFTYNGFGEHSHMFMPGPLEKNAEIIKKILNGI